MVIFGSAYPVGKLILNSSLPPMLMASIRMGIVFICLIPFWKFKIPEKKYYIRLFGFSLSMGTGVFLFMNDGDKLRTTSWNAQTTCFSFFG